MHVSAEQDHVHGVQPPAVCVEEGHDFEGRHLCVKGFGILQVFVPDLVDDVAKEFSHPVFGCFIRGIVLKAGFMGRFGPIMNNRLS